MVSIELMRNRIKAKVKVAPGVRGGVVGTTRP